MNTFPISPELGGAIHEHALAQYRDGRREACGLVVRSGDGDRYWPCRNIAAGDQRDAFRIHPGDYARAEDAGEIVAVVHSHPDASAHASDADRMMCERGDVPWLIISEPSGVILQCHPTGAGLPLLGRTFWHGSVDCYGLVRDYFAQRLAITLPDFERPDGWWNSGEGGRPIANLYRDNFAAAGFVEIGHPDQVQARRHDVLLMQVKCDIENHAAVLVDPINAKVYHHLYGRLSSEDLWVGYWRRHTTAVLRHESLMETEG
jgi:proteasome lid subunit RPN8/RPN11